MTAPTEPLTPAIQALVDAELENYSDGISYGKHSDARRSLTDFAVAVRDVARDDAAELRAALAEVMRVIGQHDDRGPHILPTPVWQRARAALAASEGRNEP